MQVILGAGGPIGNGLANELKNYTDRVRLVSRNPQKINSDDELLPGDLLHSDFVDKAVAGAEVAYLTVGLPYRIKVWEAHWPVIMKNVIAACKKHNTKLVFFDNIYMYDKTKLNPMTEETPVAPSSGKGRVRADIAGMLLNEARSGGLKALIARSADFYGPGINNAMFNEMLVKNLQKGKRAYWFGSLDHLHNFTYTPDAVKATALLGNASEAYGQVWHLPTAPPMPMKSWIEKIARETNANPKATVFPKFMVVWLGFINPLMKEMSEMFYQYDRDYHFDSSKIETAFKIKPSPIDKAVKEVAGTPQR